MKLRVKKKALAAVTLGALVALPAVAVRADDTAAEIRWLKARLKALEAKVAAQARKQREVQAEVRHAAAQPAPECKDAACPPPPPPVFVSFKNALKVESSDHDFSMKITGRALTDGGHSTQPETGFATNAGINAARLGLEGKAFKHWHYKFEYDFTGSNALISLTGTSTTPTGGFRDAYFALTYFDPLAFQVGNFYEPMGLERTQLKKSIDFIERAMVEDALTPSRHVGFAAFAHGADWTAKGGVFTTSLEDKALAPLPGGSQYWDLTGRVTYAPLKDEDRLLHLGGSARYHRPNNAVGASDDRVLVPGSNVKTEANILNENLLGAPDLSCAPKFLTATGTLFVTQAGFLVQRSCAKNVSTLGAEIVGAYGPLSVQAEYLHSHYNRDPLLVFELGAPGGSSLDFSGYYVYATWYLTGESRAAAYRLDFGAPGTFGQIPIKRPWSAGGWGAWELAARFSELNLNNGGLIPLTNLGVIGVKAPAALIALSNAGVIGGREENVTVGLNWYPESGFRFMANWIRVTHLSAPFDRPFLNGAHPNIFLMRAQVDW